MDGLSRFACLTPIFTFKKHRLTYYFVPTRNVRTGISYSPAAEAMSQPFFWGQEESISLLLGLGDGRQVCYLTHSSTGWAAWPPVVSEWFDTLWQEAAAESSCEVLVRKSLMVYDLSGERQSDALDTTDEFYSCIYLYKSGRATFVLSKKRNRVLALSSRKDPSTNESAFFTSTCSDSNQ